MIEAIYRTQGNDSDNLDRERLEEVEEVSGLPDALSTGGNSNEVVSRVRKKQQEKHERAREEFRDKLSELSTEYEKKIAEASYSLKEHMDDITEHINELTEPLSDRETLLLQSYSQLESVWSQTLTFSILHQSSIDTFSDTLSEMERKKSSALNVTFSQFSERFTRVGYLTSPQCVSLLEEEAWKMNYTLIENQRSCNQLLFRLRASYIAHEKKYRENWLSLVELWRELRIEKAVREFTIFMSEPAVQHPPQFTNLLRELSKEQSIINTKRIDLIFTISDLTPPIVCSKSVQDWEKMIKDKHDKLESLNTRYLVMLNDCLSRVHEYCLEEAGAVKNRLVSNKVCAEDYVFQVMNDRLLPPVEDLQACTEEMLHSIEQSLDSLLIAQRNQLGDIADYVGDGMCLWQQHENGLNNKERQIQEELDVTRTEHDTKTQKLESSLDLWLDKLRQAACKTDLQYQFDQAKKYLGIISEGYTEFQQQMSSIIEDYPQQIVALLSLYEESVMKGLSITKMLPRAPRKIKPECLIPSGRITRASSSGSIIVKPPLIIHEPIKTDGGITYYWMLRSDTTAESSEHVFITQATSRYNMLLDLAVESVKLPDNMIFKFKKSLVHSYLNHLETWKKEGVERAKGVVSAKNEELSSELELRLHLHEPRENNINQDIRIAREDELKDHEGDFEEQANLINTALDKQKSILTSELIPTIEKMTTGFREKLKDIECHISGLNRHTQLQDVIEVAAAAKSVHIRALKNLIKKFRVSVDDTLYCVKESSVIYSQELLTVSEGKNFAPEEIENFTRRLDSVMKNVDVFETSIKADIDTLQSHNYQVALDIFGKLSEKFDHNLVDINFMERITAKFNEIQLQIRIEIAASNSQAEDIQHHVLLLTELVNSLQQKYEEIESPDYELIRCATDELYKKTQTRIDYLFCYCSPSDKNQASTFIKFQKVTSDVISAMGVTRSIVQAPTRRDTITPSTDQSATPSLAVIDMERAPSSNRSIPRSRTHTPTLTGEKSYMSQRRKGLSRYQLLKNPSFGMEGGNDTNNPTSLLPKIRKLLYSKNDEFFQMSDSFYRSRSSKSILRIDSLPETSEMCMLNVNKRLHSYRTQIEEYRIQCIQELRGQLEKLYATMSNMPLAVFTGILYQITLVLHSEKKEVVKTFSEKFTNFEEIKKMNRAQLRPNLGHIANRDILDKLCQCEIGRHNSVIQAFEKCNNTKMEQLTLSGESFTSQLEDRVTFLSDLFQKVTLPSTIIKLADKHDKQIISSVKRLNPLPENELDSEPNSQMYIDIPKRWFNKEVEYLEKLSLIPSLPVPNISDLYSILFESRDSIFMAFFKDFVSELRENTDDNVTRITRENVAFEVWEKSVTDIKSLFM
ncbi:hypothetical protein LOD99_13203 [Oopsacas minuta]|uniref:Uncharacterized protein n=1 Tax=Oopsacas minuta TaxID=111878 RepID=A0AAV7JB49_9METZ|nr:hypothetical protein LOD99_13203 [Oopsacas minuta]